MTRRIVCAWILGWALLPALAVPSHAGVGDEPLPPDQAFGFSAEAVDERTIEAVWDIAEGYYLYHDKISFSTDTPGAQLGKPDIPPGKKKKDEFFGEVETHRHELRIRIPVEQRPSDGDTLNLIAKSQGCADLGICYPPYETSTKITLPAAGGGQQAVQAVSQFGESLGLQDASQEFLDPEEAFKLSTEVADNGDLIARWAIADAYYLYRDKFQFKLKEAPEGVSLGRPELPEGEIKDDQFFGRIAVFHHEARARVPLKGASPGDRIAVDVTYQGCAEAGLCYPPQTKTVNFTVPATAAGAPTQEPPETAAPAETPESAKPQREVGAKEYWLAILGAFGIGLVLTFTPCVLPMIPILSSIIVGQAGQQGELSKLRGGMLSAVYVLGTTVTYAAAGVLAGLTGDQLQAYFQNVWAIGIFATILVLLALSMFGFYELQMPSFIQSRLQSETQRVKGGTVLGVFVMGLISALIVGACVSPLLISVLALAMATADPVLGAATMFSMGLGMGVILILVGVGAGFLVPKAGTWMDTVKYVFGVLLLAVAIYLLGAIPEIPVLFLWAALLIVTGVYMGATQSLPKDASGWRYLWKGLGTVLVIWGVLALLGGFAGNRDIFHPIQLGGGGIVMSQVQPRGAGGNGAVVDAVREEVFEQVKTMDELERHMTQARQAGKPVLIDFYADWCTDCLRMERGTFSDPRVQRVLNAEFVALQVDVTDPKDPEGRAIKQRFGVFGPPAVLIFSKTGEPIKNLHFYGYMAADEFLEHIRKAL